MTAMGKEASLDGLEFDGETVLCRVCGDKASGFHYGVHACEGCKGFFRRSIQQKIQYRPCLKNQQCNIMRVNRNRCQYCRLKKCISVGMSRDAVRFGRVPKKEKARIMEQMQKVNSQSSSTMLSEVLDNENDLVHTVVTSHKMTNEFTRDRVQRLRQEAFQRNDFMSCPAHMACPLNVTATRDANDNKEKLDDFSEYFTPAIKCVVDFAKSIPGFQMLSQDDQVTLLKAGTFEVLLLRFASLFDPVTNTMLFTNGKLFKRQQSSTSGTAGFLLDSMFDFADRFSKLNLTEEELALFSAIILLAPDRPGLRNIDQVERIQNKLTQALQNMINSLHMEDSTLFAKLLMKTTDLRTLNTLHSEKLIGPQSKENETLTNPLFNVKQEHVPMDTDTQPPNEMMLNFGSPPSAAPINLGARPGIDHPMGASSVPVVPQRMPMEGNSHQKMVLQTPYGTFYREEVSGFYGYLPDQPRQRCHTLDRETMSRPSRSLHVIDEGNRRRYTLDKEYISKMVNKLSNKLEKRAAINDDYNPPSVSSSVCSSPVPDDQYSRLAMGNTPDSSTCSSRTSPIPGKERYSPSSPNPRSRSGSMVEKDYEIRRRCYSFHLNSEGRAARNLHPAALPIDAERLMRDGIQPPYSADARRGSVGASYGLHRHEKALLMERGASHLLGAEGFYRGIGKRPSKGSLDDPVKFQRVQTSVGLSTPTLSAQLAASPLDKTQNPPTKASPPQNDLPKLAWMSPNGSRLETVSPPTTDASGEERKNQAAKIVVSDFSSSVVHKKFDKFRKTSPQPAAVQAQDRTAAEASASKSAAENEKSQKPSAAEAHPQLMAHLQSPPPGLSGSSSPNKITPSAPATQLTFEPHVVSTVSNPQPISAPTANGSPSKKSQPGSPDEKVTRDPDHATTMLSLRDKLLKKIDSMDNLTKINSHGRDKIASKKEAPRASATMPPAGTAVFTSQPPHTMYAPSPIYSPQVPMYPAYYGLRYPGVPGIPMMPQAGFPQGVPAMSHLASMYQGPVPHLRPTGQPLNLTKSLEELSHSKSPSSPDKPTALGSPQRPASEEMVVS